MCHQPGCDQTNSTEEIEQNADFDAGLQAAILHLRNATHAHKMNEKWDEWDFCVELVKHWIEHNAACAALDKLIREFDQHAISESEAIAAVRSMIVEDHKKRLISSQIKYICLNILEKHATKYDQNDLMLLLTPSDKTFWTIYREDHSDENINKKYLIETYHRKSEIIFARRKKQMRKARPNNISDINQSKKIEITNGSEYLQIVDFLLFFDNYVEPLMAKSMIGIPDYLFRKRVAERYLPPIYKDRFLDATVWGLELH